MRQGWHQLDGRLAGGDTLVVVAIDRIGRTWRDTMRSICELQDVMFAAGVADQELQSVKRRTEEDMGSGPSVGKGAGAARKFRFNWVIPVSCNFGPIQSKPPHLPSMEKGCTARAGRR